ncbi:hypothetical protein HOD05_03885 [Candidatus Woesearchaeota archaeon]|jgi:PBP1b-binding outer membrane lipoprotein LpoB|nr:hypothetical protein [Candidatus Woesearchaeota archaeon]MBT4150693.1 hypothetical protein [Candidatus Woesearchaeota archaeon]MBT4247911.1 hypothetical protein [Candidatus Woesearchaeota archaeon]MBT4434335.1 hypothetical protein [Candidatus Woesearchaeota archaeon]MBT7332276.1 hypothetical protein [Candidatus Woesearchaeota archaeon]
MKRIIFSILILTLFIVGCAEQVVVDEQLPVDEASEVTEINDGLTDLEDLDTFEDELDAVNLDDLDDISLE